MSNWYHPTLLVVFKTERYINNLITRQLPGKGRELQLYVTLTYPMNTFVSPTTGFSPYELVFLKKPSDILNLYFQLLQNIAKDYEHYCIKMKTRLDNVGNVILDFNKISTRKTGTISQPCNHPT